MVAIVVLGVVMWPRVSFLLSAARPIVDTLSTNMVYVGDGAGIVDAQEISSIIGKRPIVLVVLGKDDSRSSSALQTCQAVADELPQLLVEVVVDGTLKAGCEGDDVRYQRGVNTFGWDFVFWYQQDYATTLLRGDIPGMARQLALAYDAEVMGGRLVGSEREFQPPPARVLIAIGLAVVVIAGAMLLLWLMGVATRRMVEATDDRRRWQTDRSAIDGQLGEIALIMIQARPGVGSDRALATAVGSIAPSYVVALRELDSARPGDELSALAERVRALRDRLGRLVTSA